MEINVTRSSMPDFEDYCNEIRELWDSRWLTNMGVKHRALQAELEKYLDVPHVTLFTNGHLALESAISAMDLPEGSEVITTPFTFASTTNAIIRSGFVPVFCDINENDYTIDASKIEALITEKTAAIVPVHVYGNICDVIAIERIAKKHGLKVVYDAAHAFGTSYKGVSTACFGDASMFSFHATKVFHTIEGGAVCCKDSSLVNKLEISKNFGMESPENFVSPGGNAKMSEFQAAMGLCNLRILDSEISKRKAAVEHYTKRLSDIEGITLCREQTGVKRNYAYFPVVFSGSFDRNKIFERLKSNGIIARKYFYPLTNGFGYLKGLPSSGEDKTPVARYIADRVLTLPLYAGLENSDIDRICDIIT